MGALARDWQPVSEIEYCRVCAKIDGLSGAEALIAWSPQEGIRSGDIVICEYHCKDGRRRAFLTARQTRQHLVLQARCGYPDFYVSPGSNVASNGLGVAEIVGIVRGSYLCF